MRKKGINFFLHHMVKGCPDKAQMIQKKIKQTINGRSLQHTNFLFAGRERRDGNKRYKVEGISRGRISRTTHEARTPRRKHPRTEVIDVKAFSSKPRKISF